MPTQPRLAYAKVLIPIRSSTANKLLLHANKYDVYVTSLGEFRVIGGRD